MGMHYRQYGNYNDISLQLCLVPEARRARERTRNPESAPANTETPSKGMNVSEVSSLGSASAPRAKNTTIETSTATCQLRAFTSRGMTSPMRS
jgi:hypothetical protein